jgi:hypothetical protein
MSKRQLTVVSRALLIIALAILVGGLIYDSTREGDDPDLASLYIVAVVVGLVAMMLGLRARRAS